MTREPDTTPNSQPPLAIVAGGGALPVEVADAVAQSGRPFVVVAIRGEAGPEIEKHNPHWLDWGQIGKFFDILAAENCRDMVMIGSVTKRPDFRAVTPDLGALVRLPRIIAAIVGGDDGVMKRVIGLFEREGLSIVAAQDVAPQLLAEVGPMTKATPDRGTEADIVLGIETIRALGSFDVGQAVAVVGGRVIAIEAAEGTDAMLRRCAELRQTGRLSWRGRKGALVKFTKPGQEIRTDLPTIGTRTVELTAEAGLAGLAVEAGGVLVAEKSATIALANEKRLFVEGRGGRAD